MGVYDEIVDFENEVLWKRMDNFQSRCPGCGKLTKKGGWCTACERDIQQEWCGDILRQYSEH